MNVDSIQGGGDVLPSLVSHQGICQFQVNTRVNAPIQLCLLLSGDEAISLGTLYI
jgi:hypothetical protein